MILLLGATQDGADSSHDLFEAERLGHIVVASHGKPHDLVLGVIASGQVQHRRGDAFLPDASGHREPIDVRKHHIKHDQIRLQPFDDLDGFGSRSGRVHFETGEMQGCHQQLSDGRLVIDNDNGCFNRLAHGLSIAPFTGCFLNGF